MWQPSKDVMPVARDQEETSRSKYENKGKEC
jgi:hypothetical protein